MKELLASFKALVIFTLLTGVFYPVAVTVLGKFLFPKKAEGTLIREQGKIVGSELIAQPFSQAKYFWPRPSAVKYDAGSSGASNLSVTAEDLVKAVREREAQGAVADMKYSSGSGLDPHISVEAALSQIQRVSQARGLKSNTLIRLLDTHIEERQFRCLGQKRVNVLLLNLDLDKKFAQ